MKNYMVLGVASVPALLLLAWTLSILLEGFPS